MKKQILASLIVLSGLTASFSASATEATVAVENPQPLMTETQIQEYKALHAKLGVTSISGFELAHDSLISDVNNRLKKLKNPEQKLIFTMAMNHVTGGNFHVNDNAFVKLNTAEQNYFDTYYTFVLDHLNKELSVGEQPKEQLIAQYEKTFPFKIYEGDLKKFIVSEN